MNDRNEALSLSLSVFVSLSLSLFFSTARGASLTLCPPRDFAHRGIRRGDDSLSPEARITGFQTPSPVTLNPNPALTPLLPALFVLRCWGAGHSGPTEAGFGTLHTADENWTMITSELQRLPPHPSCH